MGTICKTSKTDLWTLQVNKDCNRYACLFSRSPHAI